MVLVAEEEFAAQLYSISQISPNLTAHQLLCPPSRRPRSPTTRPRAGSTGPTPSSTCRTSASPSSPLTRGSGAPPASARGGAAAAVLAYGLLNLNVQHNVHVIHQRLRELKNNGSPAKPPPPAPRVSPAARQQQLTPADHLPVASTSPCSTVTTHAAVAALPPPMSCFHALDLEQAVATAAMTPCFHG